jgi:hypothetical protein
MLVWLLATYHSPISDKERTTILTIMNKLTSVLKSEKDLIDKHNLYSKSNAVLREDWSLFEAQFKLVEHC